MHCEPKSGTPHFHGYTTVLVVHNKQRREMTFHFTQESKIMMDVLD